MSMQAFRLQLASSIELHQIHTTRCSLVVRAFALHDLACASFLTLKELWQINSTALIWQVQQGIGLWQPLLQLVCKGTLPLGRKACNNYINDIASIMT